MSYIFKNFLKKYRTQIELIIMQLPSFLCLAYNYTDFKNSMQYVKDNDEFGNFCYPVSLFNSSLVFSYNSDFRELFYLLSFFMIFFSRKTEEQNSFIDNIINMFCDFFVLISGSLFLNVLITACFIPAINPEISSLQFPVLYFTNEYNKIMQLSPIAVIMIYIIRVATFFGILKTIFVMILSKSNSKKIPVLLFGTPVISYIIITKAYNFELLFWMNVNNGYTIIPAVFSIVFSFVVICFKFVVFKNKRIINHI